TGPNPLTQVQPDMPGLIAAQQPTQVRGAPGAQSPGAFGSPNQASAAGNVAIDVDAGRSAVFLLVDGGSILGNVIAGRLGVHGAGGTMTLSGALGGSQGAEAARFADITRPIPPQDLQRYRVNGCVISSINCVVPPSIQIIPPRPTDRTSFTIENNRINATDVLIPNIAEEDDDE
ncbi:MAG: filamentous hemagglutinin N-terminal protein, partial [Belnapia sp.]|nr:filamentous hemagglutinin N-terminal protein [Belnapia sp.]